MHQWDLTTLIILTWDPTHTLLTIGPAAAYELYPGFCACLFLVQGSGWGFMASLQIFCLSIILFPMVQVLFLLGHSALGRGVLLSSTSSLSPSHPGSGAKGHDFTSFILQSSVFYYNYVLATSCRRGKWLWVLLSLRIQHKSHRAAVAEMMKYLYCCFSITGVSLLV